MLRRWIVAVVVLSLAPVAMSLTSTPGSSILPGRYIVVLKDSADAGAVAGQASTLGATVDSLLGSINTLVVSLPLLRLGSLQRDPRVAFVTPDRPVRLLDNAAGTAATGGVPTGVLRTAAAPVAGAAGPDKKTAVAIVGSAIRPRPAPNVVGVSA